MDARYPSGETVFEYAVDPRKKAWVTWDSRLPQGGFKPPPDVPAYRCAWAARLGGKGGLVRVCVCVCGGRTGCRSAAAFRRHTCTANGPNNPTPRLLVPTIDTLRNKFVVGALASAGHHALVFGGVGVGKTMTLQSLLEGLPADRAHCSVNFSAQTTSNSLQARPPRPAFYVWGDIPCLFRGIAPWL
jgi:hypothetical protein